MVIAEGRDGPQRVRIQPIRNSLRLMRAHSVMFFMLACNVRREMVNLYIKNAALYIILRICLSRPMYSLCINLFMKG